MTLLLSLGKQRLLRLRWSVYLTSLCVLASVALLSLLVLPSLLAYHQPVVPVFGYKEELRRMLAPWEEEGISPSDLRFRDYDTAADVVRLVIVDHQLYYSKNIDSLTQVKRKRLNQHLTSVMARVRIPDVAFLTAIEPVAVENKTMLRQRGLSPRPVLSLSRTSEFYDILYPNMYFGPNLNNWIKTCKNVRCTCLDVWW